MPNYTAKDVRRDIKDIKKRMRYMYNPAQSTDSARWHILVWLTERELAREEKKSDG